MSLAEVARILGQRGGRARAGRLSPARRRKIAAAGGRARALSLRAARRIEVNLQYAAAAAVLRGGLPVVTRRRTHTGRLPGLYR